MPSYYNPYNFYPASYLNQIPQTPQQNFSTVPAQGPKMMEWVEGEVGAKAYQMPNGWPANSPIPLWDSTDTVIYLKSWGPMGIPNPMQKLKYEMPEQQVPQVLTSNTSSTSALPDMSQYVTKEELEDFRREISSRDRSGNNQNGNGNWNGNNNGNGNGNWNGNNNGNGNNGGNGNYQNRGGNK